jgi:hypothetical protein
MPVVYDATWATARARRGGIFLTARRKNFSAGPLPRLRNWLRNPLMNPPESVKGLTSSRE